MQRCKARGRICTAAEAFVPEMLVFGAQLIQRREVICHACLSNRVFRLQVIEVLQVLFVAIYPCR
jgi:hypothetical protein